MGHVLIVPYDYSHRFTNGRSRITAYYFREPGPIPAALDLTRFLTPSIAFMMHLSEVRVYFDDMRLARLSKNRGVSRVVADATVVNGLKGTNAKGIMNVISIDTMREFTAIQKGFICILSLQHFTSRWK